MLSAEQRQQYREQSIAIIRENDRGTYTVPTKGLYPFQWNWDSCLTSLGIQHYDEARAWQENVTLFEHQWEDGMVPHIIFHEQDEGYFPGPDVYQTNRPVPTSGLTQPPVTGFVMRILFERAQDKALATEQLTALLPKVAAWHEWFYRCRDPQQTGLVAVLHPWETGRDNSVDWDVPFARVPTDGIGEYTRRDIQHADPAHRPTKEQYDRYLWLVQRFRSLKWDNTQLHEASPFQVVDPGFNAILIRSCIDLAVLADGLGETELAARQRELADKALAELETLWSAERGQYLCLDRTTGQLIDCPTIGGILPAIAAISDERMAALARRIEVLGEQCRFLIPSHDPTDSAFDSERYWRGPSWLITNYMIADGLERAGHTELVKRIVAESLELIKVGGFSEYFDPHTGAPCGGGDFTWTAAMVLEFLSDTSMATSGT